MKIAIAETDAQILSCFQVLKQLRPNLQEANLVPLMREKEKEGAHMVFLIDDKVRAVAVYRKMSLFATGIVLYVDDLVTDKTERSKGYGKALLQWLKDKALHSGCDYLELDSGLVRKDAHRFYRTQGMEEVAYHFSIPVEGKKKWAPTLD